MVRWFFVAVCVLAAVKLGWAQNSGHNLDAMIARHAAVNGVPVSLVRRVIRRESGYNPRAVSRGNFGLMQIRLGTARAMGYRGSAAGLLNPDTNMTYAVRYLAGAYHAAGGNEARAQSYYQTGYYRRGTAVASRRSRAPAYALSAPTFGNWQVASVTPSPRNRHARPVAQTASPSFGNWQVASVTPSPRNRHARPVAQTASPSFNWQVASVTPEPRNRHARPAAPAASPSINWQAASPPINWQVASVTPEPRNRHARPAAPAASPSINWQTASPPINWQVASVTPEPQNRRARFAAETPSQFGWEVSNWQSAQAATPVRHRNLRYAMRPAPSVSGWQVAQSPTPRRARSMRYATATTPSLFNFQVARATPAYRNRHPYLHTRHVARSAPTLLQSLQKLFTPPRHYRVARLYRGTTR